MTNKQTFNFKYENKTKEQIATIVTNCFAKKNKCVRNLVIEEDGTTTFSVYSNISYEDLVNKLVKERYSDSEEFAILRKAINGVTDEFVAYNTYVEECKTQAKAFIAERDSSL